MEVLFAASVSHSLKLSLLYYGIADEQNFRAQVLGWRGASAGLPAPWAVLSCPFTPASPGNPALAFALKIQDPHTLPFNMLCRTPVQVSWVWICVAEGKNGPGLLKVAWSVSSAWPSGWPLSKVTNLLRHRCGSSRQSANVETH